MIYYVFDRILARFGKDKKKEIVIEETELSEAESEVAEYV
ncbi:Cobalt-zinc-cadmium resistance protein CzcA [Leifsonia rubra CMS 76R]|nr:Cobalt-zinc-cadmium resistance protein CzcA [Leifsonia rubra CMS 76R]